MIKQHLHTQPISSANQSGLGIMSYKRNVSVLELCSLETEGGICPDLSRNRLTVVCSSNKGACAKRVA